MSKFEVVNPGGWPRPSGYSSAVAASGKIIFVSGQVGWNPESREFESDDFVAQVAQALRNVVAVLTAAGAKAEHITRLTWYVTDREAYLKSQKQIGEAYRKIMGRHFPAMSAVFVSALVETRAKVEIEATAVVPS